MFGTEQEVKDVIVSQGVIHTHENGEKNENSTTLNSTNPEIPIRDPRAEGAAPGHFSKFT